MAEPDPLALLRQLYETAQQKGLTLTKIQQRTGISRQWSSQFLLGQIKDPGAGTTQSRIRRLQSLLHAESGK